MIDKDKMPKEAFFQRNSGWGSLEETIGSGTKYYHHIEFAKLDKALKIAREALVEIKEHGIPTQKDKISVWLSCCMSIDKIARKAIAQIDGVHQ